MEIILKNLEHVTQNIRRKAVAILLCTTIQTKRLTLEGALADQSISCQV